MSAAEVSFIGLDLAWSERNRSGGAVLDRDGLVVEARSDLGRDDEILAWVRGRLAPTTVIGIDMPTIVKNPAGRRPCEAELAAAFRKYHAGPHPANTARFNGEGRARALLDALATDGVSERLDLPPRSAGRFAFEVFPHPAHIRLFGLETVFKYKKKAGRSWASVLAEWSSYRAALATLHDKEPALVLGAATPAIATQRGYKRFDDLLDAISCAYIASYLWRWGTSPDVTDGLDDGPDGKRIFGDLVTGYIAVPGRARCFRNRDVFRIGGGKGATMSTATTDNKKKPFLTDIKELRKRAKEHIEKGPVTKNYTGDVKQAIEILQAVLATEIVCVLRYTSHAIAAVGIDSEAVKEEFTQHAREEQEHMNMVAERINQLGGKPNFNPAGLDTRSASEYGSAEHLIDMIKENLIAERIAVEHYRELVRYFADNDPTTRVMLEGILATEEEHANDMHDLLVAHEGKPFIEE